MPYLRPTVLLAALISASCAPGPSGPPRSTLQIPTNARELEPPNSLPPGFTTNHPLAPQSGVVGVTRVP